MGVPLIYLSEYSLPIFSFVFCDELTESQLVHAAVQRLLDQGAIICDRIIETVAAGEFIRIKPDLFKCRVSVVHKGTGSDPCAE